MKRLKGRPSLQGALNEKIMRIGVSDKCNKCAEPISDKGPYEFKDKKLCADCYIDLIIGVPEVDLSQLPEEVRCHFQGVRKNWNRDRPNRHQIKFCSPQNAKKISCCKLMGHSEK